MTDHPTDQPDAALHKKLKLRIEKHMLTHPFTRLGKQEFHYDMSFDALYAVVAEFVIADRERLADELFALPYNCKDDQFKEGYNTAIADAIRVVRGGGR